jgi:hypothetical protein
MPDQKTKSQHQRPRQALSDPTGSPRRVQRKRTKGWRMPPNTVSVCRPGKWGNPYKVGDTIAGVGHICGRADAVKYFEMFFVSSERLNLSELRGKNLACFCPLDQPCHADVLLRLAND